MMILGKSAFAALAVSTALAIAPAQAQQSRSFVSGLGNDANAPNCTRTAPCRTFQAAHNNTLADGEITVLDPGSYGSLTITKNISIINDGVGEAGVLVSGGGVGITINASATDAVTLRGITIKGIGFGGGDGIHLTGGFSLSIENCVVRNLTGSSPKGNGIIFNPAPSGGVAHLVVSNTFVTDNSNEGIWVVPFGTGGVHAVFNRVTSTGNGDVGILLDPFNFGFTGGIKASAESSVAAQNSGAGFWLTAGAAFLMVTRSVVEGNNIGFRGAAGGVINVGGSAITGNGATWVGNVQSLGDNYVAENQDGDPAAPLGLIARK